MRYLSRISFFFFLAQTIPSWAVDLQPNDIVAPLPNKNYLMMTYYDTENATLYKNGSVITKAPYANPAIGVPSVILRGTHTYEIAGLPAVSYAQLPYGTVSPGDSLASFLIALALEM